MSPEPAERRTFQCHQCSKQYCSKPSLCRHIQRHHMDPSVVKWYRCPQCPFKALDTYHLHVHTGSVHATARNFACDLCPFRTTSKRLLRIHRNNKHCASEDVLWLDCPRCPYRTKYKSSLALHQIRLHTDTKGFRCDQCSFRTKTKTDLRKHIQHVHKGAERPWLVCDLCPYRTQYKTTLVSHKRNIHDVDVAWVECHHCTFRTKSKVQLSRHILNRHTDEDRMEWFKCDQCQYRAKMKSVLNQHVSLIHQIRWLQCDQCQYRSKWPLLLRRHRRGHSDGKFHCEQCPLKAGSMRVLKAHMAYAHGKEADSGEEEVVRRVCTRGGKWHECDQCTFKTKVEECLHKHVAGEHTRPYVLLKRMV